MEIGTASFPGIKSLNIDEMDITMKITKITFKTLSILLPLVMLFQLGTISFAEEAIDSKELIGAEIISIPLKNLITFGGGKAETPDGIRVELYYDNTSRIATIYKKGESYYADDEMLVIQPDLDVVSYGLLTETLLFENGIKTQYNYYSSRLFPLKYVIGIMGNINIKIN